MRPMDFMGDALLKFLLSAQLYGCVHPLTSGKLTQTRQQLECNRFFAFLTAHLGMHRLLRCGSPALSDDIVSYVKEIKGKNKHMKKKRRSEMSGTGHDKAREDMDDSDSSHSKGPSSVRPESVPSKVASGFYRWSMPVPREQWDPRDKKLLEAVKPMEEVEDILGYSFRDKGFLLVAFTHESFPASARVVPGCMRPMDFMGDALLKFLLSAQLYGCVHPLTSGKLTQTRQQLECNRFFAFLTAHLGMHRLLRCGSPALSDDIVSYVKEIKGKGFLLVAFTHGSFPASARVVPGCMRPMDFMGDALLKFLLSAQLYGCVHPLTSGKLTQTRQQLECNRFFAFLTAHLGMHRLLRCGSPALSDDIVSYVKEIKGKEEPPSESKCPPKPLADLFEALACAVYFDSGQDLATVWRSVFPNLRPHIESHVGSLSGRF